MATTRGKLEAISTSQVSCNYQDTRAMYDNIFLEIINGECQVTRETVPLSHPLSSKTSNFPFTLLPKVFDSIAFETPFKMLARLTYLELPK